LDFHQPLYHLELAAGCYVSSLGMITDIIRQLEECHMAKLATTAVLVALAGTVAGARAQNVPRDAGPPAQILASVPADAVTVTNWYKQNVYDPSDNKIGQIMDVLVDHEGKAEALIIGVGGFLGMGEKDVAVPFNAVHVTKRTNTATSNNPNAAGVRETTSWYLVMNSSKDALKNAKRFKYDRTKLTWVPEEQSTTTGSGSEPRPATSPMGRPLGAPPTPQR
jgi:sporulation protein YlmC with PRC-barrel domain